MAPDQSLKSGPKQAYLGHTGKDGQLRVGLPSSRRVRGDRVRRRGLVLRNADQARDLQRKVSERQGRHRGRVCRKTVSTYKDWRLVCQACGVQRCDDTRLFRGYSKKDDAAESSPRAWRDSLLQSYGSDEKAVSYKCRERKALRRRNVKPARLSKDCLVALCEQCRSSKCEVARIR
ncbi:hypothetical protein Q5P01_000058 [Channa striata]|uniref:Uncharacterized protein n=1 Tax=Channa striata TaxID=64152 RepID=A0AA88IIM2_CHASR|nr:hypothetical protein Q5P01_000058 [Channa striata]